MATRVSTAVWRPSGPLWVGAAAVLFIVVALGVWPFVASPSEVGGSSPSPSVEASGPASSGTVASPSSAGPVNACVAADLVGRILGWQGAAGSRIADIEVSNGGVQSCLMASGPGLELLGGDGRILIDSSTTASSGQPKVGVADPGIELAPGAALRTEVRVSNYCGPQPVLPLSIGLSLPEDGGRLVVLPGAGISSELAAPPCLGSAPARIDMNGWRK